MKNPSALPPPPGKSSPLSEREAYWSEQLQRWRASGLSQGAYSRREGLRANQLSYWHRREQRQQQASSPRSGSGFIPVQVITPPPGATPSPAQGLSIRLSNGARIEGIDAQTLELAAQLLKGL